MKNFTELKGNAIEIRGKLKQKLAALVTNNLLLEEGKKEEELGILWANLGKQKQNVNRFISIKEHMPGLVKF